MSDAFALLNLTRCAVLPAEEARAAFQKAGAVLHPDHADESRRAESAADFAALTEALAILSSTPRRLRHLLELLAPEAAANCAGAVMDDAMLELFAGTGAAVQQAQQILQRRQAAGSALAKAMLAADEMKAQEAVEAALARIEAERAALGLTLEEIDRRLADGDTAAAASVLPAAAARAGFLEKWHQQLRAAFASFFAA
jgi:curved DNA-binding protein CbpA